MPGVCGLRRLAKLAFVTGAFGRLGGLLEEPVDDTYNYPPTDPSASHAAFLEVESSTDWQQSIGVVANRAADKVWAGGKAMWDGAMTAWEGGALFAARKNTDILMKKLEWDISTVKAALRRLVLTVVDEEVDEEVDEVVAVKKAVKGETTELGKDSPETQAWAKLLPEQHRVRKESLGKLEAALDWPAKNAKNSQRLKDAVSTLNEFFDGIEAAWREQNAWRAQSGASTVQADQNVHH